MKKSSLVKSAFSPLIMIMVLLSVVRPGIASTTQIDETSVVVDLIRVSIATDGSEANADSLLAVSYTHLTLPTN